MNECLNLSYAFFCIYWGYHVGIVVVVVDVLYHMYWFTYVDPILVNLGGLQPDCSIWPSLFAVGYSLLILCREFLHLHLPKILACNFLFWRYLCLMWVIMVMAASYNVFGNVLSSLVFGKISYKFFVCLGEFIYDIISPWTSVGSFHMYIYMKQIYIYLLNILAYNCSWYSHTYIFNLCIIHY